MANILLVIIVVIILVLISYNFIFFGGATQVITRENTDERIELIYSETECLVPTYDAMVFVKKYRDYFNGEILKNMENIFDMDLDDVQSNSGEFVCKEIVDEMGCSLFWVPLIGQPGTPSLRKYKDLNNFVGSDDVYTVFKPTNTGIVDYPTTKGICKKARNWFELATWEDGQQGQKADIYPALLVACGCIMIMAPFLLTPEEIGETDVPIEQEVLNRMSNDDSLYYDYCINFAKCFVKQAWNININVHEKMNSVNQQISYGVICPSAHIPDRTQGYNFVRKQDAKPVFGLSEAGKVAVKLGDELMEISVSEPITLRYECYSDIDQIYLVKHIDDGLYHLAKLEVFDDTNLDRTFRIMGLFDDIYEGERLCINDEMIEENVCYATRDNIYNHIYKRILPERLAHVRPEQPSPHERRKNKSWTTYEDNCLKELIKAFGTDNWGLIEQKLKNDYNINRNRTLCSQRWDRVLNPDVKRDLWSNEEDEKLLQLVEEFGEKRWIKIANEMGDRSDVQCRRHYLMLKKQMETQPPNQTSSIAQPPIPRPATTNTSTLDISPEILALLDAKGLKVVPK